MSAKATALPDLPALQAWLSSQLGPERSFRISTVQGGASNLIYRIDYNGAAYALRRPPSVANDASSNNILREMRLLRAIGGTAIPHTRLVAGCEDSEVIGAPFALLEWHPGFTGKNPLPAAVAQSPEACRQMAFELIDALGELANTDWQAIGLEGFGKPEQFLERQVARWSAQLERYKVRDIPGLTELGQWLTEHMPQTQRSALIHGDYQFINVMYEGSAPVRLTAIVDWEMATIGDPLLDLGWVLAGWQDPGEAPTFADYIDWQWMPPRAELAARYAAKTGLALDHLPYYMALAMYKLAIIMEGAYARYKTGKSDHPLHAKMEADVPTMIQRGLRFAASSPDQDRPHVEL
jgi:aminoglycoside phosphotransferase (APT) family kinase protein